MKAREPRRKVLINARMKVGASWNDARILNISPRGLLLQASSPPPRGSYLEVRRGRHIIVARVVWADCNRFGVGTQDRLPVDALIAEPATSDQPIAHNAALAAERRAAPRQHAYVADASRSRSITLQFAFAILCAGVAATVAYRAVAQSLATALVEVETALAR